MVSKRFKHTLPIAFTVCAFAFIAPVSALSGSLNSPNSYPQGSYDGTTTDNSYEQSGVRYERVSDRHSNNRDYYTNQYGDLDTIDDKKNRASEKPLRTSSLKEQRRADNQLRRDILNELGEGTERVQVGVSNGVATLTGMVLNREAMVSAIDDAYEGGARKVKNQMEMFRNEERPWADMTDRSLARAVQSELSWSPYVDRDPIRVSAKKGVVTLKGTVEDTAEMSAAIENAYEAGAKRVKNHLHIVKK